MNGNSTGGLPLILVALVLMIGMGPARQLEQQPKPDQETESDLVIHLRPFSLGERADVPDECLRIRTHVGTRCNDPNSLELIVTNQCSREVGYKIYSKKNSVADWSFSTSGTVPPRSEETAGWFCPRPFDYKIDEQ